MGKKNLLYQISTRSWIRQFGEKTTLSSVPASYWDKLVVGGFEYVWLMGVWATTESSIDRYCFHPNLTQHYDQVASEWKRSDVWGSPYAVEDYQLHRRLGTKHDLLSLKEKLNQRGLKLILDFVPNHFNAESGLVAKHPQIFMQGSQSDLQNDPSTYYTNADYILAHGRDPHFPAWSDTVQVNYYNPETHSFMTQKLQEVAMLCDGVRCDMAMLLLPDIFHQTWNQGESAPPDFWRAAISAVKSEKEFVFIAEAYWEKEKQLQERGFDFCYDKVLLDLLISENYDGLHHHIQRGTDWFSRAMTFLENHDEERSLSSLGFEKSRAAAVIAATLPGMHLFFDGQFSGARLRVPVQLALEAEEKNCLCSQSQEGVSCQCQEVFYSALLHALEHSAFEGKWQRLDGQHHQIFASLWSDGNDRCLVCTNYGKESVKAHFSIPFSIYTDLLNNNDQPNYVSQEGDRVEVDLPPFRSVILI